MKITKLFLATRNAHKVSELVAMVGKSMEVKSLCDAPGAPAVVEDANTFAGNATKKAVSLAQWLAAGGEKEFHVLADDSGLEVDVLGGAPGVHSARFAALDAGTVGNSSDAENNLKLLRLLAGQAKPWRARFRCALALTPGSEAAAEGFSAVCLANEAELGTMIFEGACEGEIKPAARGAHGFGYDPLFVPAGFTETFAELGEEIKNRISHRAKAMEKLLKAIRG